MLLPRLHRECGLPLGGTEVWWSLLVMFTLFDVQCLDQLAHQGLQIDALLVLPVLFYLSAGILLEAGEVPQLHTQWYNSCGRQDRNECSSLSLQLLSNNDWIPLHLAKMVNSVFCFSSVILNSWIQAHLMCFLVVWLCFPLTCKLSRLMPVGAYPIDPECL